MRKTKQQNRYEARAELMMMGNFLKIENGEEEVKYITNYITHSMGYEEFKDFDIYSVIHEFSENNEVVYVGTCRVYDMPCIVYCVDTHVEDEPKPFVEDYGSGYPASFCYVLNLMDNMCSEWGDCFFEQKAEGIYRRVS